MIVKCDQCGKEVDKKPSYIKNNIEKGHKTYCSNECRRLAQYTGKMCTCANCGKEIYKTQAEIKKSKTGNMFCSHSCSAAISNKTRIGELSPAWKDGSSLYTKLAYENYIKECSICGFSDEGALEVHHIDMDRKNNEIDNLIILCSNHHSLVHRSSLIINDEIKNNRKLLSNEKNL